MADKQTPNPEEENTPEPQETPQQDTPGDETNTPDEAVERAAMPDMPDHASLYAPIVRIDSEKREVEGVATSELVDSFGTIFSYEASKRAFQQWIEKTANVREMHDRKAVGKGIGVYFDDAQKQIVVRSRVSRGAQDTWLKIEDGTLSGYSVGAIKPVWETTTRDGKVYPYLSSYELAELSIVDNASNPAAQGLVVCRAEQVTDLVELAEPEEVRMEEAAEEMARAGARLSKETQTAIHSARDISLGSAQSLMKTCGCGECSAKHAALTDGDASRSSDDTGVASLAHAVIERINATIDQQFHAPLVRLQAIASTLAHLHTPDVDISPLQRSLDSIVERMAGVPTQSSLDEVRSALAEVKGQVDKIAATPMPGGPILSGGQPVDKRLSTDPYTPAHSEHDVALATLRKMQDMGALDTIDKQTAAAAIAARRSNKGW